MNYVLECLDPLKYTIYSDLPGYTVGGGSVPPEICITPQKPDIVIIDEKQKIMNIYELSVPFEQNIEKRHNEKSNKYAHFITDCTGYNCDVTAFVIGSCDYISTRNHAPYFHLINLQNLESNFQNSKKIFRP